MRKIKKFLLITIVILLLVGLGIGTFIGNFFYSLVISPKISKNTAYADYIYDNTVNDDSWLTKKSNYSDQYIKSSDNLKLHSYVINNELKTNKWAVIVHGYGEEGKLMSQKAKYFYDMGYNILIPDLRAYGKSEGDYIGMGWDDRLDVIKWINTIVENNPKSEIILHGTSMGGATVLMASGEDLPSNVKAIVSDCSYTSAWDVFSYELKTYLNIPSFPIMNFINLVTMFNAGYSIKDASALEQVKKATVPILYIHGCKDKFVPYSMMTELYEATNSPKERLYIRPGEHANSDIMRPNLYWKTINRFLQQYVS
ncbi:MAG: alpha/beta hydrolase [Terrisporobacter sp.]|uniref:alpha/beta hydrolase n=1 Tax=Terrisporobacter sp. TaxID=1965305 RepID=UPI002FC6CB66